MMLIVNKKCSRMMMKWGNDFKYYKYYEKNKTASNFNPITIFINRNLYRIIIIIFLAIIKVR